MKGRTHLFVALSLSFAHPAFAQSPEGTEKTTTIVAEPQKTPDTPAQPKPEPVATPPAPTPVSGTVFKHPHLDVSFILPDGFKNVNGPDDDSSVITFIGKVNGIALSLTLMAQPIPEGVPYVAMYKATVPTYQNTAQYQGFREIGSYANAIGFTAEENDQKDPASIHRRFFKLWTATHSYDLLVGGAWEGMRQYKEKIDGVFASFKLGS